MARALLADDHPLFLEALAAALEAGGVEVIGTAESGERLLELVAEHEPDAVVLDLEMPGMSGIDCLTSLRASHPEIKVVIVSGHDDSASVAQALDAGAVCFVGKSVRPEDLAVAVRAITEAPDGVHYGSGAHPSPETAGATGVPPSAASALDPLTKRERQILLLASEGRSNGQIARLLWVTEQTVKFHLSNIYKKLEVGNRTQAAARARALGLEAAPEDTQAHSASL